MTESFDVSIVLCTWHRPSALLLRSVHTLSNQTIQPREIIVVDANTDPAMTAETNSACAPYPLVKVLHMPLGKFSVAKAMNYGIKRAGGKWLVATCMEELFSRETVEVFSRLADESKFTEAHCGSLPEAVNVGDVRTAHERWPQLLARIEPGTEHRISTGAWMGAATQWWHSIRGYDEVHYPYENPDADLARQAGIDGLKFNFLAWGDCQILHQWHPVLRGTAYEKSSEWYYNTTVGMVRGRPRNPNGWGEG